MESLEVHLENYQRIYFRPDQPNPAPVEPRATTLVKFFDLCRTDEFAQTLRYIQVPSYYTWQKGEKGWQRRKQGKPIEGHPGIRFSDTLGRVHTVPPNQEEAYCLRMLLNELTGPTSFDALKRVGEIQYDTFKDACRARKLLGKHKKSLTEKYITYNIIFQMMINT